MLKVSGKVHKVFGVNLIIGTGFGYQLFGLKIGFQNCQSKRFLNETSAKYGTVRTEQLALVRRT